MRKIKVLIVDDSLFMRTVLNKIISSDPRLEVVGTATNGLVAIQNIPRLKPDCITLDVEMPEMDGLATLKHIMQHFPTPVIMLSAFTQKGAKVTIEALSNGAVDFVHKIEGDNEEDLNNMAADLIQKIKVVSTVSIKKIFTIETHLIQQEKDQTNKTEITERISSSGIIAIGISTGGPNALQYVLSKVSPDIRAGIVIVQHMPAGFTKEFAESLNRYTKLKVSEARQGEIISPGTVFIAPGGIHMLVSKGLSNKVFINLDTLSQPVAGHKPSADSLFFSVAKECAHNTLAIIMTGMGRDGASGIAAIHDAGGTTIAQDEKSCVIYGMPRVAIESGCIDKILSLDGIAEEINKFGNI